MIVRLAGVRGSLPAPGPSTVRYGGNTTCVAVETDGETVLVLDAGSGIRPLGAHLAKKERDILLMLTHVHWDHVQGFPFFHPLYEAGRSIRILLHSSEWIEKLKATMDGRHYFPLSFDQLPSSIQFITQGIGEHLEEAGLRTRHVRTNHPGLCFGYRVESEGRSLVFIPDNELAAPDPHTSFDDFVQFAAGADLLIHDCQYTDAEIAAKSGWGHSSPTDVCRLAREARVGRLVLFHHDPDRSDEAVESLEARARDLLQGSGVACDAAAEQEVFRLH